MAVCAPPRTVRWVPTVRRPPPPPTERNDTDPQIRRSLGGPGPHCRTIPCNSLQNKGQRGGGGHGRGGVVRRGPSAQPPPV